MFLYNKNILEYTQIFVTSSGRFMIFHIKGHCTLLPMYKIEIFFVSRYYLCNANKREPGPNVYITNRKPTNEEKKDKKLI